MSLLQVEGLRAGWGPVTVLHGLDFSVERGEICALLGPNGAGKTTTLKAISGVISRRGSILFDGRQIVARRPVEIARLGVGHVPEGRGTFVDFTVSENIRIAAHRRRDSEMARDMEWVVELFPVLGERWKQPAGTLSGGEQQMLAIARVLMLNPRLLLLDEPSLGLAPRVTELLFRALSRIRAERGVSMLVVEQNANLALTLADRAYLLEGGTMAFAGDVEAVRANRRVMEVYLGYTDD
jgi:branched-chain amino acid transport system ATP-binding protein